MSTKLSTAFQDPEMRGLGVGVIGIFMAGLLAALLAGPFFVLHASTMAARSNAEGLRVQVADLSYQNAELQRALQGVQARLYFEQRPAR